MPSRNADIRPIEKRHVGRQFPAGKSRHGMLKPAQRTRNAARDEPGEPAGYQQHHSHGDTQPGQDGAEGYVDVVDIETHANEHIPGRVNSEIVEFRHRHGTARASARDHQEAAAPTSYVNLLADDLPAVRPDAVQHVLALGCRLRGNQQRRAVHLVGVVESVRAIAERSQFGTELLDCRRPRQASRGFLGVDAFGDTEADFDEGPHLRLAIVEHTDVLDACRQSDDDQQRDDHCDDDDLQPDGKRGTQQPAHGGESLFARPNGHDGGRPVPIIAAEG
jgi:hypothetical protein